MSVHNSRELTCHGKRWYDSTGLRAKHNLITPRMRCASLAKPRHITSNNAPAPQTTKQKIAKRGSRLAPSFGISEFFCNALLCADLHRNYLAISCIAPESLQRFYYGVIGFRRHDSNLRAASCSVITGSDCAASRRGDASCGANSCCACGGAARGASSRPWSRCPASVARLAKPAPPTASPLVKE
jgi:hypothetical protein